MTLATDYTVSSPDPADALNTTNAAVNDLDVRVTAIGTVMVNVAEYGAALDGVTDDSAAWAAAYAACPSGGTVVIPQGRLTNTSGTPWAIGKPITIRGPGGVKVTSTNVQGFTITSAAASGTRFDGLVFDGPDFAGYSGNSRAVSIVGGSAGAPVEGVRVTGCTFTNWRMCAVWSQYTAGLKVQDCTIDGTSYGGVVCLSAASASIRGNDISNIVRPTAPTDPAYGIALTRGAGSEATDPRSSDCAVVGNTVALVNWEGIDTHSGTGIAITGNTVTSCFRGIAAVASPVSGVDALAPLGVTISGNTVDSNVTDGSADGGIYFTGAYNGSSVVEYATGSITGNHVFGHAGPADTIGAVTFYYTRGLVVTGNDVHEASGAGAFSAYRDNLGFTLTGNTIVDVWSNSYSGVAAVNLRSGTNTGTIGGNNHVAGTKTGPTYLNAYGLRVSSTTATSVVLGPNSFAAATTPYYQTATVGKWAAYDAAPIVKPTVTGSRGGNAALADLLTKLASLGLIVDSSS